MAIKGGNPLFKVEVNPTDAGFIVRCSTALGNIYERDVGPDDPLLMDYAMFGAETKFRNTIGAITDATKRTPEGADERALAIFTAHDDGKWNVGREAGEGAPSGGIVAQAVAKVIGKTVAEVVAHVKGQVAHLEDEKVRAKALREAWDVLEADPEIGPTVNEIRESNRKARLAKVAANGGAKAILAGLK